MTIKDIIKISATMLGRENVVNALCNDSVRDDIEALNVIDNLTRCANLVISELSFTYIPMKKIETINTDGKIKFEDLSEKLLEIISVKDSDGYEINYDYSSTYLRINGKIKGEVSVEYSYLPVCYGLTDTVGYRENEITPRTLALGVISEFLLIERAFSESVMWRERYTSAIGEIVLPKSKTIKKRSWI